MGTIEMELSLSPVNGLVGWRTDSPDRYRKGYAEFATGAAAGRKGTAESGAVGMAGAAVRRGWLRHQTNQFM